MTQPEAAAQHFTFRNNWINATKQSGKLQLELAVGMPYACQLRSEKKNKSFSWISQPAFLKTLQ